MRQNNKKHKMFIVYWMILVLCLLACIIAACGHKKENRNSEKQLESQLNSTSEMSTIENGASDINNDSEKQTQIDEKEDVNLTGTESSNTEKKDTEGNDLTGGTVTTDAIPSNSGSAVQEYTPVGIKGTGSIQGENMKTYVFLGIDTRSETFGPGCFSDIIMLATIDKDKKEVRLCSVYRDSRLKLDGGDFENINHAYYYGGPSQIIKTLNDNLDLELSEYVECTFGNYIDFIDMLGGIDVELTQAEVDYFKWDGISSPGTYTLDGTKALAYARLRKIDTDFQRTSRQRNSIKSILIKAKALNNETRMEIVSSMLEKIQTNCTLEDISSIITALDNYEIVASVGTPSVLYNGIVGDNWSVIPVTLQDMASRAHLYLYGNNNYHASETVKLLSEELGSNGIGANLYLGN